MSERPKKAVVFGDDGMFGDAMPGHWDDWEGPEYTEPDRDVSEWLSEVCATRIRALREDHDECLGRNNEH